jgi:hypothetical protein
MELLTAWSVVAQGGVGGAAGGGEVPQPQCIHGGPRRQTGVADARQLRPRCCRGTRCARFISVCGSFLWFMHVVLLLGSIDQRAVGVKVRGGSH